jgi:outer membrane protein OmpA-like peptidoglycan-associated protein
MRASRRLLVPFLAALSLAIAPGSASAQTQEFSVQRFEPAPGPKNYLGVETLRMEGDWQWSVGLFMNYSQDPFVVKSCDTPTTCSSPKATNQTTDDVVRNMFTWDLLAAVSPRPWVQVGLRVPLSYVAGEGLDLTTGGALNPTLSAFGVGDPYLEAKFRLLGKPGSPLVLGVAGDIAFAAHSSTSTNFIGDSSPVTGGLRGIAEGQLGSFLYGANLRAVFRESVTVGENTTSPNTSVGSEFRYGVAAGYNVTPVFVVFAEGFGATGFSSAPGSNSLEIDGALRWVPKSAPISLTGGAGPDILTGAGVPAWRVFLGLMYAAGSHDRDHDGISDDVDRCPDEGGDVIRDPKSPRYGCPDGDRDNDGIKDSKDKCPDEPENANGYQDGDGCPDQLPDRDKDGIPDDVDKCPDAGGPDVIRDPKSPYYGCPDRDHDGVPDYLDKCPDEPEATDDLWDGSGCPHVHDRDKDGIPDEVDKCPDEPETYNGYQDADGCPDRGPTAVEVTDEGITIHDRVEFATGKDRIEGKKSFQVLDAVAGVLEGHKEILLLEVQGHTDNTGGADANRELSQKRAQAVTSYLAGKGVETSRLSAKGYGPDKPIADNKTKAGRQQNRRVEFHILDSTKKRAAGAAPAPVPGPAPVPAPVPVPTPPIAPAPVPGRVPTDGRR